MSSPESEGEKQSTSGRRRVECDRVIQAGPCFGGSVTSVMVGHRSHIRYRELCSCFIADCSYLYGGEMNGVGMVLSATFAFSGISFNAQRAAVMQLHFNSTSTGITHRRTEILMHIYRQYSYRKSNIRSAETASNKQHQRTIE